MTEGALVTANQTTTLVTVQQLDPIYVDIPQSTALLLRFKREIADGQIKAVGDNEAQVTLTLEDGSRYDKPGRLQFAEVTVDQGTGAVILPRDFSQPLQPSPARNVCDRAFWRKASTRTLFWFPSNA